MMEQRIRKVTCIPAKRSVVSNANEYPQKRVAAYCRVSTEEEEQQSSFENQVSYYTNLIQNRPEWTLCRRVCRRWYFRHTDKKTYSISGTHAAMR